MAGISSKALKTSYVENKKKKFQGQEYNEDLGVDIYEFKYRMDDPQTGRFWQVDPLADKYVYNSTYAFSENQVISYRELEGLEKVLAIFFHGGPDGGANKTTADKAGGAGKIFNNVKQYAETSNREFSGTIIAPGWFTGNSVKTGEDFITENYKAGDEVIIYGYSYGGDAAIELAKDLKNKNIDVGGLVTVDGSDGLVGLGVNATSDSNVPSNTKNNLNVYQDNPSGHTRAHGRPNEADDPKKTNVTNVNVTKPGTSHGNIQEKNESLIEAYIYWLISQVPQKSEK